MKHISIKHFKPIQIGLAILFFLFSTNIHAQQETGFRVLVNGLHCLQTGDEATGADEPYMEVYVDGSKVAIWGPRPMNEADRSWWEQITDELDKISRKAQQEFWLMPGSVYAQNEVTIKLYDEDDLSGDDFIGEFTITSATADNNYLSKEFDGDNGKWLLVCTKKTRSTFDANLQGQNSLVTMRVPILNQGGEGACVAFATTAALTTSYLNKTKPGTSREELFDPYFIYDNRSNSNSEGMYVDDALNILLRKGIPFKRNPNKILRLKEYYEYFSNGTVVKVTRSGRTTVETGGNGYNKMRQVLKSGEPLITRYDVYPDFMAYASVQGVYGGNIAATARPAGHAVVAVGYNNPPLNSNTFPTWILQNSWGSGFGNNGLCYFAEGACGFDASMYKIGDYEIVDANFDNNPTVEYKVEIDACHKDLDNEGTGGRISVEFLSAGKVVGIDYKDGVNPTCGTYDAVFKFNSKQEITDVRVRTNTGDAFYIDEIRLYKAGTMKRQHGREDGKGWCLSTDANDANGAWSGYVSANSCKSSYTFSYTAASAAETDSYKVEIDNCHSDLDNTGTGNKITVEFYSGSTKVTEKSAEKGIGERCIESDYSFSINTSREINAVVIKTNGSDGFYIDELRLYKNNQLKAHHGRDNGSGWCLSTDPNDAGGAWSGKVAGNTCKPSWRFGFVNTQETTTYEVAIDNCHSDLDNGETGNKISVEFWAGNRRVKTTSKSGVSSNCLTGDESFKAEVSDNVTHVIVKTDGDDGFYIDELRMYKAGKLVAHHGRDDGSGWCLSTDPNDAKGGWAGKVAGNTCRSSWRFEYKNPPPSKPSVEYRVEMDNCHSDLDHTDTGNKITVEFWAGSQKVTSTSKSGVSSNCWSADETFTVKTSADITHIIVRTNGNDGFYIDEIRLYKNGSLKQHHGRDNGSGWCLSTDPNDANGGWAGKVAGNTCKSNVRFNY